ncbi:MAG: holo-ACP synthase [Betaproteobacteria bacterium]|nr:holo-ACP synthase [Betaproteobacteria bacterium]
MIYGIGADIVAIPRMDAIVQRHGERFAQRILAGEERAEYAAAAQKGRFLAKRFAAKEAFAKAAGTGVRPPVNLSALRVTHDALGRPGFAYDPALAAWMQERGIFAAHLSLSDEQNNAIAFVILETA